MKLQVVLVLSLAYAASAQYNYYARPLSGYGQMAPTAAPPMMAPLTTPVATYAPELPKMFTPPMTATPDRILTKEENPCTEDVLRSTEIQAFKDPLDRTSYIVCTEIDIFVRMPCASGTFFDEGIRHCVPEGWVAPVCPVGLCKNNADCIIDELKNEYKCLCRVGYTGLFCETNIDECALEGNAICGAAGGMCVDQLNAYYCDFGSKIGVSALETINRPCTLEDLSLEKQFFELPSPNSNVFLQCTGESKWLVSKCADMLFWNQELRTCTIDRPIKKTGICLTYPCKNDGECNDLGNFQFQCTCKPGFTGPLCEDVIDFCFSSPCGAGRCVSHPGGYNCICQDKVVDQSCTSLVSNPCRQPLEYLPYPSDQTKYFSCGLEGLAFVKSCAPSTFWDNIQKTCLAPEIIMPTVVVPKAPKMSIFDGAVRSPSYQSYEAPRTAAPVASYQSYETTTLAPRTTTSAMVPPPMMQLPTTTVASYQSYQPQILPRPQMTLPTTTAASYQSYEAPRMTLPTTTVASYQSYQPQILPKPQMMPRLMTPPRAPVQKSFQIPTLQTGY